MTKPCKSSDEWTRQHHAKCSVPDVEWEQSSLMRAWALEKREHDPDDRGAVEGWCVDIPEPQTFHDGCRYMSDYAVFFWNDEQSARLAAAAPALVRALLMVEWGGLDRDYYDTDELIVVCPCCEEPARHARDCELDAALTAAGLATQEERDAARREMGK